MTTSPWSKHDLKLLRHYARQGQPASFAADRLGRSAGAVRFKACREGISFHSLGRRHSKAQRARYA